MSWFYRSGRPSCSECKELKELTGKGLQPDDCKKCGYTELLPCNFLVHWFVSEYSGIIVQNGAINPYGIDRALELEEIEKPNRKDLFKKIMVYLKTAIHAQGQKNE